MEQHAQVADMADPVASLNEDLWGLEAEQWKNMEDCLHSVALDADADIHAAWRPEATAARTG